MPNRSRVILTYGDVLDLTQGAPTATYFLRASAYDPDLTGTGEQPVGFDQWMEFYTNFLVTRARLRTSWGAISNTNVNYLCSQYMTRSLSIPSSVAGVLGQPYLKQAVGNQYKPVVLDSGWQSMADFFGEKETEYRANDAFWGTSSADPTVPARFALWGSTLDGATNFPSNVVAHLELEVEFFNRTQLNAS